MLYWLYSSATVLVLLLLFFIMLQHNGIIRRSKRYFIVSLIALFIMGLLLVITVIKPLSNSLLKPSTIVVGYAVKSPFVFFDEQQGLTGIEVKLLQSIFPSEKYKIVWYRYEKDNLPSLLQSHKIDIAIAGFTSQQKFVAGIISSKPYIHSKLTFFSNDTYTKKLKTEMQGKQKDLLKILATKQYLVGLLHEDEINNFSNYLSHLNLKTQSLDNFEFILQSLNANYLMVGVSDEITFNFYQKNSHSHFNQFTKVKTMPIDFVMLTVKQDLEESINTYLQKLNKHQYNAIMRTYQ